MAQSDYELAAHISGLNQRTEINSIFDSILTHNSGSVTPTVTKAFMMWVDTSNATYYYLKMRNHDNTAWVTLFIYTVSTKVITPFIINSPTINAIPKINSDGTIENSNIINDARGNTGIGVTPSAWVISGQSVELFKQGNGLLCNNQNEIFMLSNTYYNNIWKYAGNGYATLYKHFNGAHEWRTAPSGTAGNPITWTNIMTLNNNGNLLIGTTTDNGVDKLQVNGSISSGPIPDTLVDVNTLKLITRTYVIHIASANIPISDYGYLEVIVHSSGMWIMQRFTCLGTTASYAGRTFVRCFINGTTWTAWVEK